MSRYISRQNSLSALENTLLAPHYKEGGFKFQLKYKEKNKLVENFFEKNHKKAISQKLNKMRSLIWMQE